MREEWPPPLLRLSGLLLTLVVNLAHLVSSWAFVLVLRPELLCLWSLPGPLDDGKVKAFVLVLRLEVPAPLITNIRIMINLKVQKL